MKLWTSLAAGLALVVSAGGVSVLAADKRDGREENVRGPQRPYQPSPRPAQGQGVQGQGQLGRQGTGSPYPTGGQGQGQGRQGQGQGGQNPAGQYQTPGNQNPVGPSQRPGQGQNQVGQGQGRQGQGQGNQSPSQRQPNQEQRGPARPTDDNQVGRGQTGPGQTRRGSGTPNEPVRARQPIKLETKQLPDGSTARATPSGRILEKSERKADGEHVQKFNIAGTKQADELRQRDGTVRRTQYDLRGNPSREEVVKRDGSRAVTTPQLDREGKLRARETVTYDSRNRAVSKSVERNVTKNVTINKTVHKNVHKVVHHYDRSRYGFCYRPIYFASPFVFVSWYDPYWYTPAFVPIYHPFRYSWGWESYGWYSHYHGSYWSTYDVYPAPSYWVTDRVVAGYVADHYATSATAAQALEEARLAREEAARAWQVAEEAKDAAELAEAKAAAAQAELRARDAEAALARAQQQEAFAGKANPNATPINKETKEALRLQVEATIAEQKQLAEKSQKEGKPVLPDLAKALADPKRLYPVSGSIRVTAADPKTLEPTGEPAGELTEGDLVKLAEGQKLPANANENTPVVVRVITSKGEVGEARAGALVVLQLKDLQSFDNEFRAKLDESLEAANENKAAFKSGAL